MSELGKRYIECVELTPNGGSALHVLGHYRRSASEQNKLRHKHYIQSLHEKLGSQRPRNPKLKVKDVKRRTVKHYQIHLS
jgi:hypothetical protein